MHGHRGASVLALVAGCGLIAALPFVVGQGCSGTDPVIPITGGLPDSGTGSTTGNIAPTFRFTAPLGNVQAEIGDSITVTWIDSDPDNDARIAILLDVDADPSDGNEIPLVANISEDDPTNSFTILTGNYNLQSDTYRIIARVSDGVNPEFIVAATGQINLFASGLVQGNVSPSVVVTQPRTSLSVSQGSQFTINYCESDRDDGEGGIVPDVLIMLDNDNNPLNDVYAGLDLTSGEAATAIAALCAATLPAVIDGGVVLGCTKDNDCANVTPGTAFPVTVDPSKIPQRPDGEPYYVRVSVWDRTNPPVHAYAPGKVSVTSLASGTVDLGQIGRQLAGTRFIGFDTGAHTGSTGTSLGDFDQDGAADFLLVARFGRPFERGNIGSAYLVYGATGQRFGSEVFLNSFGVEYRGCMFAMGHAGPFSNFFGLGGSPIAGQSEPATEGIVAVSTIEDMNADGKPEIMFGMPFVERVWDYVDDDPCDKENLCYFDIQPNPLSTPDPLVNDDLGFLDRRESLACPSTDGDPFVSSPLDQGMIVYVSSSNAMENTVLDLSLVGQQDPDGAFSDEGVGGSGPAGARLRGGQFFALNSTDLLSFTWDANNRFGQTLGSMPDLSNGDVTPVKDGRSEYLFSLPSADSKRGRVEVNWGQDFASFCAQAVQSIPDIRSVGDCSRVFVYPGGRTILGAAAGDEFGFANRAGDFNRDGHQDILCGAPGSPFGTASQAGTIYVIFGRLDLGDLDLSKATAPNDPTRQFIPRMEIHGTNAGDRFGENQLLLGDINSDGFADIAVASQFADGPGGIDSGYVGIIFGGRGLTGENSFTVNQIGTSQLPGAVFYGSQAGGHAGSVIADAGDFNHDGFNDLLICAPGESQVLNQQSRRGVAYLIFGGPHLINAVHSLSEVGTSSLPGMVIISPYAAGTADEATIDFVGAAGDVDADGFADILIGVSEADFVNSLDPSQRRVDAGEGYLIYGNNTGTNALR